VESTRRSSNHIYPPGSVLSLVTWRQKEDEHWFGARIPGEIESVEFVIVKSGPDSETSYSYEDYQGRSLTKASQPSSDGIQARQDYILSQTASFMP